MEAGDELTNVREVLDSGWLTTGYWAQELESLFSQFCQVPYALSVNSCTAALHLAVEAMGIGPGDQVIVPTMTFTATAEVLRYVGADPVFVDVDPDTLLITPEIIVDTVERCPAVKAVMVVHFAGQPAEMGGESGIIETARKHGLRVIQDAAHAFPATDCYGPIGSIGEATCFSFYANKTLTCGEGGMLVTADDQIMERAKLMRLHGIDRDVWDRFSGNRLAAWEYDICAPGFKYNLPDINAAVGVAQFQKSESFRLARQKISERYTLAFSQLPGVKLIRSRVKADHHAHHLFPIVLTDQAKINRADFVEGMSRKGVGTSVHYRPLHRMKYYRERYKLNPSHYPNAEAYWHGCVSLPIYPALSQDQLSYVIDSVQALLG